MDRVAVVMVLFSALIGITTPGAASEPNTLHPAFVYAPADVEKAIQEGQQLTKKAHSLADLGNRYRQVLKWTRGKAEKSHGSYVWFWGLDGLPIQVTTYNAAKTYENLPESLETFRKTGAVLKSLHFEVVLTSVPTRDEFNGDSASPDVDPDVNVVKVVLSDDKGHNFAAEDGTDESSSNSMTFALLPPQFATGPSSATGKLSAASNSNFTRTEYTSWNADRPYNQARYYVEIALFDAKSQPRIGPDVKVLTLHVLTETGEMSAEYKLPTKSTH